MSMTLQRLTPVVPLDQAIRELDSPAAVADRRKRALDRAKALEGDARGRVIWSAGTVALDRALAPLRTTNHLNKAELRAAEAEAGLGVDRLVLEECMVHLRAEDMRAIYFDPDRLEAERIWAAYANQVTRIAFTQGNEESRFLGRWKALIEERHALELDGTSTKAIDRRLESLVGVPFPQMPQAAWDTADLLPAADRQAEYDRLTAKYGPREPTTTPTTTTPPRRRARK